MSEFKCNWAECPTAYNPRRITFIEAPNSLAAEAILEDHIMRQYGIARYSIHSVVPYTRPSEGRVISDG